MNDREELINSLKNEIKGYEHVLQGIKDLNEAVSNIQERKKEAEAKLLLAENAPPDFITEIAPVILPIQLHDQRNFNLLVDNFKGTAYPMVSAVSYSSGSTSSYDMAFLKISSIAQQSPPPIWMEPVKNAFSKLAEIKAKKTTLPPKLDKINVDLGKKFNLALKTVDKARNRIVGVDQAAIHMRDILQQAWGGLVFIVRKKYPKRPVKFSDLYMRKESNRNFVAECLGKDDNEKKKLILVLDNMSLLHSSLSVTDFGKNPLSNDRLKLEEFFNNWILQLDDLVSLVDPS